MYSDLFASGWFFQYSYFYAVMTTIYIFLWGRGSWVFWGGGAGRLLPPQIPRIEPYLISISHHTHAPIDHVFFRKLRDTCARVGANFATISLSPTLHLK